MTSVLKETKGSGDLLAGFRELTAERFAEAFGRRPQAIAADELEARLEALPAAP